MKRFLPILALWGLCLSAQAQSITWLSACSNKNFCLNFNNCSVGNVLLTEKAATTCGNPAINYSYKIDLNNNGSTDIQGANDTVSGDFAKGTHKISWRATDNCGNVNSCTYLFTIRDCQPPNLICLNGLTQGLNQPDCAETFMASQFILSLSDNCTPTNQIEIAMRLSGAGTGFPAGTTSLTFGKCDIGVNFVEVWVRDGNNLTNSCNSYVLVQENNSGCACDNVTAANLNLHSCARDGNNKKLSTYRLRTTLESTAGVNPPLALTKTRNTTDSCLRDTFKQLPLNGSYRAVVRAERTDSYLNGVSTYDLVLIARHILGAEPFPTFYQVMAADVNKSHSVTTFDIVELRKLILGIYDTLPKVPSWSFIRPLANPTNLVSFDAVRDTYQIVIPTLTADVTRSGLDFVAVKSGDVNNNASLQGAGVDDRQAPPGQAPPGPPMRGGEERFLALDVEDRPFGPGEELLIPVRWSEACRLHGWQLTLYVDPDVLDILDVEGIDPENYAVLPDGSVRVLSFDALERRYEAGEALLTLRVRARASGRLAGAISLAPSGLPAEAYTTTETFPLKLRYNGVPAAFQAPRPNPFADATEFGVLLETEGAVRLTLWDVNGRLAYERTFQAEAGWTALRVGANELPGVGLYAYRLEAGGQVWSGRVVLGL